MNTLCVSCQTLQGRITPPGGILYENSSWVVFLHAAPALVAGQAFIVLKRHCEHVAELTLAEQETLGVAMAKTARAMSLVLNPEKVHFGLYAESIKHIHLHVTPRVSTLPAGNIPLVWLSLWHASLEKLKIRRPISADVVTSGAHQLKEAFQQIEAV